MFVEGDTRWSRATPSSSPPSSPTAYNDSSPASSPGPDYDDSRSFHCDDAIPPQRASPLLHPFAASAKGSRNPPEYEKGGKKSRRMSPSSPTRARVKKPRLVGPEASLETLVAVAHSPRLSMSQKTEEQTEAEIWGDASAAMVDNGQGTIDLDKSNLNTIPTQFIEDLHTFCVLEEKAERSNARNVRPLAPPPLPPVRTFGRAITAPAILGSGISLSRVPDRTVGVERQDIRLFLANNNISVLPLRLLYVEKLTSLSLRNNRLKTLPPEVCHLKNLRTLNLAGNLLEYLPAEISQMTLDTLIVFPNPFKQEEGSSTECRGRIAVSPTTRMSSPVPRLVELAFRSLFSTPSGLQTTANLGDRQLARTYELPLCEDSYVDLAASSKKEFRKLIPPHLRRVLEAIHPGSVDLDPSSKPDDSPPGLGVCPGPHHRLKMSVFVTPAEERFTWEKIVAGAHIGGNVPLKWRGCLRGCLDFLSIEGGEQNADEMEVDRQSGEPEAATHWRGAVPGGFGEVDFEDGE